MTNEWFFTGDLHFNHKFMQQHRGFCCREQHNYHIIEQWNVTVNPKDNVIVCGDTFFGPYVRWLWKALNGNKIVIKGNHDHGWLKNKTDFDWRDLYHKVINMNKKRHYIAASHYPMRSWKFRNKGGWNLHGHSHANLPPMRKQLDVGVDSAKIILGDYRPFSLEEVYYLLEGKNI